MRLIDMLATLLSLAALFSWINLRYLRLPTTIGLMLIALLTSLGLLALAPLVPGLEQQAEILLVGIRFDDALLHGVLALLLFAGALHVNLEDLVRQGWVIGILASASVIGATVLVGLGSWVVFILLGQQVPLIYCLIFGALIAPTDPIAVLGIMKSSVAPKSINAIITGESLLNDGVAVVTFLLLLRAATSGQPMSISEVSGMLAREALGGLVLGFVAGWSAYQMLRRIDDYKTTVLISLAVATGVYSLAENLRLSAPIAVVVAGLVVANHNRLLAMSSKSREQLHTFWELVDEVLNAMLFVVMGLEVLILDLREQYLLIGLLAIPLVLFARLISVGLPIGILRRFRSFSPGVVTLLTWAGLRGGVSVALALSLPTGDMRDTLVAMTYVVVVFSILIQGPTLGYVVQTTAARAEKEMARTGRLPR